MYRRDFEPHYKSGDFEGTGQASGLIDRDFISFCLCCVFVAERHKKQHLGIWYKTVAVPIFYTRSIAICNVKIDFVK